MSKYMIEIEDEPFGRNDDPNIPHGMDELYRAKGFNSLVFDQFGLDKLTPLNEAMEEAYQKGLDEAWANVGECEDRVAKQAYQKGLGDAWKTIIKIAKMPDGERGKVFGETWISNILNGNSLAEITEKLKAHEQQKTNAEIKVGDEVMSNNAISDHTGVVLALSLGETSAKVLENDGSMAWVAVNVLIKTGRHFNFLTPLLNEMKEGAE